MSWCTCRWSRSKHRLTKFRYSREIQAKTFCPSPSGSVLFFSSLTETSVQKPQRRFKTGSRSSAFPVSVRESESKKSRRSETVKADVTALWKPQSSSFFFFLKYSMRRVLVCCFYLKIWSNEESPHEEKTLDLIVEMLCVLCLLANFGLFSVRC